MPQVTILAGPNGAGKSTLATKLVPDGIPFLNADNIARERAASPGPSADLAAGRILLAQVAEMESARRSFAIETNLANRSLAVRIPSWQTQGYHVALAFIWLPSADIAVERVAKRVLSGGHDIPEATIRRRYEIGLKMFFGTYRDLVDSWRIYDNSSVNGLWRVGAFTGVICGRESIRKTIMPADVTLQEPDAVQALWDNDELLDYLAKEAVQDALREHKRKGESIAVWRDGKVVTLTADEIPDFPVGTPPLGSKPG